MRASRCLLLLGLLAGLLLASQPGVHATRVLRGEPDTPDAVGPAEPELQLPVTSSASLADQLLTRYLSNDELAAWSADFVSRCGSIARRFSIGRSTQGADLWVTEIAAQPGVSDGKPNFRYVANMHGDEPGGRMLLPMLAEWLCANAASDARATRIIQGMHLFLMPTMNPDGFTRRTRANGAGADLNRNFPSVFRVCAGKAPEQCDPALLQRASGYTPQPETAAVMAWSLSTPFTAAANLHEGAIVANYPWDGYNDGSLDVRGVLNLTPDTKEFKYLSQAYAAAHSYMSRSPSFGQGITNGAAWYPIYGSLQDWSYTAAECLEITLELSQSKYPSASALQGMWADNLNALLALPITSVLGGLSGRVTAAGSGAPVAGAVVTVDGIAKVASARGAGGYYNKPLAPGSYTVRVSAPGYRAATATVTVPAGGAGVVQDFSLSRSRMAGRRAVEEAGAGEAAAAAAALP